MSPTDNRSRRWRVRLTLTELEGRAVPALLTVSNPNDGQPGSLRDQIGAAGPGDTIAFAPALDGTTLTLTLGELDLTKDLNFQGPGAGRLTITTGGDFRAFAVGLQATVTFSGLTVADIVTSTAGAAIYTFGHLTLSDCAFADNAAEGTGGAVFNQWGTLRIGNCRFTGNSSAAFGGAVVNFEGSTAIRDSSFVGNRCHNDGGAVFNTVAPGGPVTTPSDVTIDNCYFGFNDAGAGGGGVLNEGEGLVSMTIRGSTFEGNHAGISGGGVYNNNDLTLSGCTITDNTSDGRGGGLFSTHNLFLDAPKEVSMHLTVDGCTIFGNHSLSPALLSTRNLPPGGGGIFLALEDDTDSAALTNCTIAGNDATTGGGGVYVFNAQATAVVRFADCTIAGNALRNIADGVYNSGFGGGIGVDARDGGTVYLVSCTVADNAGRVGGGVAQFGPATLILRNTLVARNTADTTGPDVFGTVNASSGYNLIGDGTGLIGIGDGVNGNRVGTAAGPIDPRLGPLQDNGGPTFTLEVLAGSPAVNAGDPSLLGVADQRGVVRGGGVNVGSYQATAAGFGLSVTGPVVAGQPFDVQVVVYDIYGQVAVGYTGTVYLFSTDPQAPYLAQHAFTPADGGGFTFAGVQLFTPGGVMLVALDGPNAGGLDVTVLPA